MARQTQKESLPMAKAKTMKIIRPLPILGLTGGIACGKSTASDYLAAKGVHVVDADFVARKIVQPGGIAHDKLKHFLETTYKNGPKFFDHHGELNRPLLNQALFADPNLRRNIEAILHPLILGSLMQQIEAVLHQNNPEKLIVLSAPLLFETGLDAYCAKVLVIACSEKVQLKRLHLRDGFSESEAKLRLQSQMSLKEKESRASWVVRNDTNAKEDLYQRIEEIWPEIRKALKIASDT